jgi:hypothetical protein
MSKRRKPSEPFVKPVPSRALGFAAGIAHARDGRMKMVHSGAKSNRPKLQICGHLRTTRGPTRPASSGKSRDLSSTSDFTNPVLIDEAHQVLAGRSITGQIPGSASGRPARAVRP